MRSGFRVLRSAFSVRRAAGEAEAPRSGDAEGSGTALGR